jgi:hypothetical protein
MWVIDMLLEKIESLRYLLYELMVTNDADLILHVSEELDDLIVRYYNECGQNDTQDYCS